MNIPCFCNDLKKVSYKKLYWWDSTCQIWYCENAAILPISEESLKISSWSYSCMMSTHNKQIRSFTWHDSSEDLLLFIQYTALLHIYNKWCRLKIISRAILQKTRAIHAHIMVLLSSLQVHTSSPQNFLSSAMHTLATATQPRLPWKLHMPKTIHSLISKEMIMYMYPSLQRCALVPKMYLQRTYLYKVNPFLSG